MEGNGDREGVGAGSSGPLMATFVSGPASRRAMRPSTVPPTAIMAATAPSPARARRRDGSADGLSTALGGSSSHARTNVYRVPVPSERATAEVDDCRTGSEKAAAAKIPARTPPATYGWGGPFLCESRGRIADTIRNPRVAPIGRSRSALGPSFSMKNVAIPPGVILMIRPARDRGGNGIAASIRLAAHAKERARLPAAAPRGQRARRGPFGVLSVTDASLHASPHLGFVGHTPPELGPRRFRRASGL